jgi:hypothetical protein
MFLLCIYRKHLKCYAVIRSHKMFLLTAIAGPQSCKKIRGTLYRGKKVKPSHYRPQQAHRVPGGQGSQISKQSAHESGRLSALRTGRLYPPGNILGTNILLEAESTPGPECDQWKNPPTSSGIEPATCRFVAQCLNQLRHRGTEVALKLKVCKSRTAILTLLS